MTVLKSILGLAGGGLAGLGFHALTNCMGSVCHCDRPMWIPTAIGALTGTIIATFSAK